MLGKVLDLFKLRRRQFLCDTLGHEEPMTIMFKGKMVACCPRCGAEL